MVMGGEVPRSLTEAGASKPTLGRGEMKYEGASSAGSSASNRRNGPSVGASRRQQALVLETLVAARAGGARRKRRGPKRVGAMRRRVRAQREAGVTRCMETPKAARNATAPTTSLAARCGRRTLLLLRIQPNHATLPWQAHDRMHYGATSSEPGSRRCRNGIMPA